jgi:hypothetical protein
LHRLGDFVLHGIHLGRRGRLHFHAFYKAPDCALAYVGADIGGGGILVYEVEIATESSPGARGASSTASTSATASGAHRTLRSAFAEDHCRYALADHAFALGLGDDGGIRVVVHVDESGRNDEALGVDGPFASSLAKVADRCDLAGADADIGQPTVSAGAVDHGSVRNDDVVRFLGVDRKSQKEQYKSKHQAKTSSVV